MAEKMTLHDRVEFALRDAGFDLDEASRIATLAESNIAQPAQAVDVGRVKEVIARLHETSRIELRVWSAFAREQADKLTRAIGNAQTEGSNGPG